MKRIVRLTESDLHRIVKRVLSEQIRKDLDSTQAKALQFDILSHEVSKGIAKIIPDGKCKKPDRGVYVAAADGDSKNWCKFTGSKLCKNSDGICAQSELIDGQVGDSTRKAFNIYKNVITDYDNPYMVGDPDARQIFSGDELKAELRNVYGEESLIDSGEILGMGANFETARPMKEDSIKAFQLFVWAADVEKEIPCKGGYKTILCGEACCNANTAVDGKWGENTRAAWKKFGKYYINQGYNVNTSYSEVENDFYPDEQ